MNVRELKEALETLPDEAEVMIGYQPNYPIQCNASHVVLSEWLDSDNEDNDQYKEDGPTVWIVEDQWSGSNYGPRDLWDFEN